MMTGTGLLVVVTRDTPGWQAEIAGVGELVRHASSLNRLDRLVRQRLGPCEYEFHTGDTDVDRVVGAVRAARRAACLIGAQAQAMTVHLFAMPGAPGSARELAVLLDLSPQRIHQLRHGNTR